MGQAGTAARRPHVSRPALIVVALGVAVTVLLAVVSYVVNRRNEERLLTLQVRQAKATLQAAVPSVEVPLASAAEVAGASGGDATRFGAALKASVGTGHAFRSAALYRFDLGRPTVRSTIGGPAPAPSPALTRFLVEARQNPQVVVTILGSGPHRRLVYAYSSNGDNRYVAYAESPLTPGTRVPTPPGNPFSELDFALYLGAGRHPVTAGPLLETNTTLPLPGDPARATLDFGNTQLVFDAVPAGTLGGVLANRLWWLIALLGAVLTAAAAAAAERLARRRATSERLRGEVEQLLGEQRSLAVSLQRALLPQTLPALPGTEVAARYQPGVHGVEIGGDWYDIVPVDDHRFVVVVGDVSGRGVEAGTVMASMRFAIRGFVSEGHCPAAVLAATSQLLDVSRDGHFATVLCGVVDLRTRELTLASAGHLPPLLLADGTAEYVHTVAGPPLGVAARPEYPTTTVSVPTGAVMLTFTDGLVERRGENLDAGLARMREAALAARGHGEQLDPLLDHVMSTLLADEAADDTAILGVRWLR